jgi:BirA family transcriptional regulator, biotin operon repressor / biotin---[acetyl-CoA-carboxylase] ligase
MFSYTSTKRIIFVLVFSDSTTFTENIINLKPLWAKYNPDRSKLIPGHLIKRLFTSTHIMKAECEYIPICKYAFITEHAEQSQFSILMDILRDNNNFRDGILCLAGSGQNFKGYRNRKWESLQGNIHVSLFLNPDRSVKNFHTGFTILSAVSVVQTIDSMPGLAGKAAIKWVNDIMIDGAKVSGVLTQTQTQGEKVSGVFLGIGLNVRTTPTLQKDVFVPQATALCEYADCTEANVLYKLLENISSNYKILNDGGYDLLLKNYRQRSLIIGREITVHSDPVDGPPQVTARGKVLEIGENLELYLKGIPEPVTRGRITFNF